MIAQAWAMHQYIQQGTEKVGEELTENSQQQEHPNGRIQSPQIPSILAKEMEQQLSTKSDKKLYEEVGIRGANNFTTKIGNTSNNFIGSSKPN